MKTLITFLALAFAGSALAQSLAPDITRSIEAGKGFTLTATVDTGTPPLSYQWWKDGSQIAGATKSTLVVPKVADKNAKGIYPDAGKYAVHVTNAVGSAESNNVILTVTAPVAVTVKPSPAVITYNSP